MSLCTKSVVAYNIQYVIPHNLCHLITDQSSDLWLTVSSIVAACTTLNSSTLGGNMETAPCSAELTGYLGLLFNIIADKWPSGNMKWCELAH